MANLLKVLMFLIANWKEIYSLAQEVLDVLDGKDEPAEEKSVAATFKKKGVLCSLTGVCK